MSGIGSVIAIVQLIAAISVMVVGAIGCLISLLVPIWLFTDTKLARWIDERIGS